VFLSPKSHDQLVAFVEVSVNVTSRGTKPEPGSAVKEATGRTLWYSVKLISQYPKYPALT
jgi:hypothetical protein